MLVLTFIETFIVEREEGDCDNYDHQSEDCDPWLKEFVCDYFSHISEASEGTCV